ncbi:MAG TPA: isopentenyl-diphosphate Delta-isomerase [Blastocatellia bacterium]|nr:isopentenyl-diphosphate Delta-isomerase [Blastocatellia bacterium]
MEELILVNENDEQVGTGEKLQVHREGRLHRAFSIFVFDSLGRLLLQKRAESKYHSGGLWSNTCCGHPRPGEAVEAAARRRLREEMNFDCELRLHSSFIYRAELDNDLVEWEYDHILFGAYDGDPAPDELEADDWQWIDMHELRAEVERRPGSFTYWLKAALDHLARSGKDSVERV